MPRTVLERKSKMFNWDFGGLVKVDSYVVFTILIYVLLIMLIGWWSSRKIHNMDDFLVAGRRLPYWMATATLLATWFGAGSSMGVASTVYQEGGGLHRVVADPFGAALSLIIAGFFYVALLRRMRLLTVTDIVERAYGKRAGVYSALWMVPVFVGWLGAQILGIGTILKLLFGIDALAGSLIGAAIILIYTYAGGMWAVTLTDIVQVALIIFGLSLIVPGAISQAGGFEALVERIPDADLSLLPADRSYNGWVSYVGQWVMMGLGCVVGQDLIQRSLASRSPLVAKRSALTAGIGYLMIGFIPITIGFSARYILSPEGSALTEGLFDATGMLADPDTVIPVMAAQILPSWMLALFLSALVSAIMSSADSSLLAGTSLFTNNVVRPCFPHLNDRKLLTITRISTVAVLVVSLTLALNVEKIYSLLINSWSSQLLVTFIPVTAALYFPKIGKNAIWCSMLTGPLVWISYSFHCAGFELLNLSVNEFILALLCGFMAAMTITVYGMVACPVKAKLMAVIGLAVGFVAWMTAVAFYSPSFSVSALSDDILARGSMYGFAAAVVMVIVGAFFLPRRPDEPKLWVPRSDDEVPHELEKAAQNDDIELPPILS